MALTLERGEYTRIPFVEAINEPLLFKKAFAKFSRPQQAVLKAIYGLPLDSVELQYFSAFNGMGEYDDLGFLTGVTGEFPYTSGREFKDISLILGRRWSKTTLCAFVQCYEALCGGHKNFVAEKQDANIMWVAQDIATSKANLRQFTIQFLESSPIGKREISPLKDHVTAETIRLKSALITVAAPTIKIRSQAVAVAIFDEVAFWSSDKDSANPDREVENAVRPSMLQFDENGAKILKISSPWTQEGLLWDAAQRGTYNHLKGAKEFDPYVMVLRAPTASSENPRFSPAAMRTFLTRERQKDADAFRREYMAEFSASVSGFLPTSLLQAATDTGQRHRAPEDGRVYVATLDPAFRRDAFAFCIGHLDNTGTWVQDYCDSQRGTHEHPLSPSVAMAKCAELCKAYKVKIVVSDQYHSESLQELAYMNGLSLESQYLTNKVKAQIWGEFASHLGMGKIRLLDFPEMFREFQKMEKRLTPMGQVQFGGAHDDLAIVSALNLHRCLQFGQRGNVTPEKPKDTLAQTIRNRILKRKDQQPWWNS